jgi:hypothetical protein
MKITDTLDNIISPDQLAPILRKYAQQYREDAADLAAMWQDDDAGIAWAKLADVLDRAADSANKTCAKYFK